MNSRATTQHRPSQNAFAGFEPLTGNYVYCPNQFFDVCLAYCSRGAVRIVAYVLRQTLGGLDKQGNPLQQEFAVSYRDLIQQAGVSRGAIGPALLEAVVSGFLIRCQQGSQHAAGQTGQSSSFQLRWDEAGDYIRQIDSFTGFFAGEGHRTPVPNRFFDELIPKEPLSVTKVVGAVIRHTVGYQNQFGGRRSSAPLSYTHLQNYTKLSDRSTLASAIRHAQDVGYIQCVASGTFSADTAQQQAAAYALRWSNNHDDSGNGTKTRPAVKQSNNPTSNGSESQPEKAFNNPTSIKTTEVKDTYKQQPVAADKNSVEALINAGLDRRTAEKLAIVHSPEAIQQQLTWLDARKPTENRIGMLRRAIEDNWPPPREVAVREKHQHQRQQERLKFVAKEQEDSETLRRKQQRKQRQQRILQEWGSASIEQRRHWIQIAVERETSRRLADILRRENATTTKPHLQVQEAVAATLNLPSLFEPAIQ